MATTNKLLELSETYRHYNSLIWQLPSWGAAIATGVIVAANEIGKSARNWTISVKYVQSSILLFGVFLLIALTIALYRYRAYQAACVPRPIPVPPFKRKPPANRYLQGALCLTSGGVAGLAAAQVFSVAWFIVIGLITGCIGWIITECFYKKVVKEIDNPVKNGSGNGVIKLKKLNAAAVMMCIIGAFGVFQFVWGIAATESFTQMWAEMMGTTVSESAVLTLAVKFYAVYHFIALALLAVVAVIPLRRAERWAWFSILILGGIGLGFGIALWAPYFPFMYVLLAIWIAALALSARPCLGKKE